MPVLIRLKRVLENIIMDFQIRTGEISNWAVFPVLEMIQDTVLAGDVRRLTKQAVNLCSLRGGNTKPLTAQKPLP